MAGAERSVFTSAQSTAASWTDKANVLMDEIRTIATQAGSTHFTEPELIRVPENYNFYTKATNRVVKNSRSCHCGQF